MAEEWTRKQLSTEWLSDGIKASLLQEYGKYTQPWSRARLAELAKQQKGIIDLTVGTSRGYDRPAPHVIEAMKKAIDAGAYDTATGSASGQELKKAISERQKQKYGIDIDPDKEVAITVGAAQAIDCVLHILTNPGDEVLMVDPDYGPYEPHVRMYQLNVVPVPLKRERPGEWSFDPEVLRKLITPRTRLLMMSNANNPTGLLYTRKQNEMIAQIALEHNIFVLSDLVSEEIVFDGEKLHNIQSIPKVSDRVITCSSFSKAHCLPGLRIGYAVANPLICEHVNHIVGWTTDGIVSHGVAGALAALNGPQDWIRDHIADLQRRRDAMVNRLNKMQGVVCGSPKGVYWAFPNIEGLGMHSHDFAEYLLTKGRVNVRPGFWYGRNGEGHLRIAFCVDPLLGEEGMNRMEEAIKSLKQTDQKIHVSPSPKTFNQTTAVGP